MQISPRFGIAAETAVGRGFSGREADRIHDLFSEYRGYFPDESIVLYKKVDHEGKAREQIKCILGTTFVSVLRKQGIIRGESREDFFIRFIQEKLQTDELQKIGKTNRMKR